jgi:hypothetical protein
LSNLRQEDHHADNNVAVAVVMDLQRHCSLFFTCNTPWPMIHWLSWVELYEYFGLTQGPNHPLSYFQPTALKLSCPGTTVLVFSLLNWNFEFYFCLKLIFIYF